MSAPRYATLDIGTNTVLLLVAEKAGEGFNPVLERMEITRLGRGVDRTHRLSPEGMEATFAAVRRFADEARELGATQIAAVATSAVRDAENGEAFLARLRDEARLEVEAISGDREADLTFAAASREVGSPLPLAVLDIGGGSTELVFGDGQGTAPTYRVSLDVGSVRLTERYLHGDPPSLEELDAASLAIDEALAGAKLPRPAKFELVGVAGTVTTLAAVALNVAPYDAKKVHLARLSRDELDDLLEQLLGLDVEQRRALPGMHPQRADVILAGGLILSRTMEHLGATSLVVSDRGVRWGLMYQRFGDW